MKPAGIPVSAVLDESAELVSRNVPGWAALLALTALPLRFLEAHFFNRLLQLDQSAPQYVGYLISLSWLVAFAFLPALWGRAVYAHACSIAFAGRSGSRQVPASLALRLRLRTFVSYAWAATVAELLIVALGWTWIAMPVLALYAGLLAATAPLQEQPGLIAPLLVPIRQLRPIFPFLGITSVFVLALPVVVLNLYALFKIGLALATGTSGFDLSWWNVALSTENQQFVILVMAGAVTVLEPFWIAALVAAVRRARAQESGEDLAAWFAEVRARELEESA
ncbi:MAG TPA: hypothetical protein VH394_29750 [Thermoanaerobaculia bacterium]|nr:hypothetical protein [Thermoanaerobaculia bacterium]